MTEEEKLAEEYVKSVIDVDAFDWKIGREIALAYIAGLKAGSQLDKVWQDYDAGEDCYEDLHKGKWVKRGEGMTDEMTEEEKLAEEYVRNKADKGNFDLEQFGKAYFSESSMEHAYLAGLKAGRLKWHKVADGDLPKGNCENILLYNKDHFCVTHSYSLGYYENGVFYNDCEMEEDTIAWCEIPQYTEE